MLIFQAERIKNMRLEPVNNKKYSFLATKLFILSDLFKYSNFKHKTERGGKSSYKIKQTNLLD
mgnify:CR=1 FL=1